MNLHYFNNLSFKYKIIVLLLPVVFFVITAFMIFFNYYIDQEKYVNSIKLATNNKSLSQKIETNIIILESNKNLIVREKLISEINQNIFLYQLSLDLFKNGGVYANNDRLLIMIAPKNSLDKIEKVFIDFRFYFKSYLNQPKEIIINDLNGQSILKSNPDHIEAYNYLIDLFQENNLYDLENEIVENFIVESLNTGVLVKLLIMVLLILISLGVIFWFVFNYFKSLFEAANVVKVLSEGNMAKVKLSESSDELGELLKSINKLSDNFLNTTQYALNIGEGNYNFETSGTYKGVIVDSLDKMKDSLLQKDLDEKKRSWIMESINHFSRIFAESNNLIQMSDKILSELIKYVGANQGGLYLLEDNDDQKLVLQSSFAFDKKRISELTVEIGEGLLGQAFSDGEFIMYSEIPEDMMISSGLGLARPTFLVFVPISYMDVKIGIIELGFFKPIEDQSKELVLQLAYNLGANIFANKTNEKTKKLLLDSQFQTEVLISQEEEMRQNMEELQTTQEELERKGAEVESRMNAIKNSSIAYIEFDMLGNIESCNFAFSKAVGYPISELIGSHHRLLVASDYAKSKEYIQFWEDLQSGKSKTGEFERISKNGQTVFLSASYFCIFDFNNKPLKVLKFAFDITETKNLQKQVSEMLEISNMQTEELRSQEEEMRQNMEELQSIQEDLELKGSELENRMKAINESSIAYVEFDMQGYIENCNVAFSKVFGYEVDEIKDKPHRILISEDYANSSEYIKFWDDLRSGKSFSGEFERKDKNGNKVYLSASYFCLLNSSGQPVKVMKFAFDITETKLLQKQISNTNKESKS